MVLTNIFFLPLGNPKYLGLNQKMDSYLKNFCEINFVFFFLILLFFTLTQALLFFDRPYKFGIPGIGMFSVSIFVTLFVRLSHSKRKKEIRMDTF